MLSLVWFGLGRCGDDRRHLNKLEVKLSELRVSSFLMNSQYSKVKLALHQIASFSNRSHRHNPISTSSQPPKSPSYSYPQPSCGTSTPHISPQILRAPYSNGDVACITLVQHHAKTVDIAYIYDIAIIHSYRNYSFISRYFNWLMN